MKRLISFLLTGIVTLSLWAQPTTSLFNNMGASVYMMPGSYMIVNNDSLFNHFGKIQNGGDLRVAGDIFNTDTLMGSPATATGLYDIGGNWINSGKVFSYQDSVMLNGDARGSSGAGGNQFIRGTSVTPFHHLILAGTSGSVKTQDINATVDGILALRDHELATQQYEMLVLNTSPSAITKGSGANGYVSSLGLGRLSRQTNSTVPYFYPTGTPSSITGLPFYYRPVDMSPVSSTQNIYGIRLVQNPTADSYDVAKFDDTLCSVNPHFYHRMYHTEGTDAVGIKMYFDKTADGGWTEMAHWRNNNIWNYMGRPNYGSGYGFSSVQIPSWSDFSTHPFALASKKISVNAGPDQSVTLGQSVALNPTISIIDIANVQWSPPLYLDYDNITNPHSTPTENTLYTITVINSVGCVAHDSIRIFVIPDVFLIPTAFSPNNDGVNDLFRPLSKNLEKLRFQVYNRWGDKIYETDVIGDGWDGTYKGVKQDLGVYIWKAEYVLSGIEKTQTASGNVTLIK